MKVASSRGSSSGPPGGQDYGDHGFYRPQKQKASRAALSRLASPNRHHLRSREEFELEKLSRGSPIDHRPAWKVNITPHVKVDKKTALRVESEFDGPGLLTARPLRNGSSGRRESLEVVDSAAAGRRLYQAGVERQKKLELMRLHREREVVQEEQAERKQFRANRLPGGGGADSTGGTGSSIGERTEAWQVARTATINAKRAQQEAEIAKAHTFKPKLSKASGNGGGGGGPQGGKAEFHDRLVTWAEQRASTLAVKRAAAAEQEVADVRATPTISSGSRRIIEASRGDIAGDKNRLDTHSRLYGFNEVYKNKHKDRVAYERERNAALAGGAVWKNEDDEEGSPKTKTERQERAARRLMSPPRWHIEQAEAKAAEVARLASPPRQWRQRLVSPPRVAFLATATMSPERGRRRSPRQKGPAAYPGLPRTNSGRHFKPEGGLEASLYSPRSPREGGRPPIGRSQPPHSPAGLNRRPQGGSPRLVGGETVVQRRRRERAEKAATAAAALALAEAAQGLGRGLDLQEVPWVPNKHPSSRASSSANGGDTSPVTRHTTADASGFSCFFFFSVGLISAEDSLWGLRVVFRGR